MNLLSFCSMWMTVFLVFSHKNPILLVNTLQEHIESLEIYFCTNSLNLNAKLSHTRWQAGHFRDCSCTKTNKKNQISENFWGLQQTVNFFQKTLKKIAMEKLAVGIKTIETVQHRFPITVLLIFLYSLVISHSEYSALYIRKMKRSFP